MSRFFLLSAFLLNLVGCATTPQPGGERLVSVSWQNPTPETFRFAEVSLGKGSPSVFFEEIPAYSEPVEPTTLSLTTRPAADFVFQVDGKTQTRRRIPVSPPARRDPDNAYHLRIRFVQSPESWQIAAELEPAGMARERLKRVSPPSN